MVQLEVHRDGVILSVRACPGAKRNAITGVHDGMLRVSVTQAPEKGKANLAITQVLCKSLGLKKSQIVLLVGNTSSKKRFLICQVELDELRQRLNDAVLER